jgi:hypothetical protein
VPQSRYRCCQLAAGKPSINRCLRTPDGASDDTIPHCTGRSARTRAKRRLREPPGDTPGETATRLPERTRLPGRTGQTRSGGPQKRDTYVIAAISRHNDGSMGKFSYSG